MELLREIEKPETWADMEKRVKTAINIAFALYKWNPIIVAHRAVIQVMVDWILDGGSQNPEKTIRRIDIDKGTGYVFTIDTDLGNRPMFNRVDIERI
jgi:broad specificity phosphatase PhoE